MDNLVFRFLLLLPDRPWLTLLDIGPTLYVFIFDLFRSNSFTCLTYKVMVRIGRITTYISVNKAHTTGLKVFIDMSLTDRIII